MVPYIAPQFRPAFALRMGQEVPAPQQPAAPAPAPAPPDQRLVATAGYVGVPGVIETLAVLAISGAAAYTGVRAGTNKKLTKTLRAVGWLGGVGSALIGLLYLGSKANLAGVPQVRVVAPQGA